MSAGAVYFIGEARRPTLVKIGFTKCGPEARLAAFQTGCPVKLSIYGWVRGSQKLERALHETFDCLREHGEWFRLQGRLFGIVAHTMMAREDGWIVDREAFRSIVDEVLHEDVLPDDLFGPPDVWETQFDRARLAEIWRLAQ